MGTRLDERGQGDGLHPNTSALGGNRGSHLSQALSDVTKLVSFSGTKIYNVQALGEGKQLQGAGWAPGECENVASHLELSGEFQGPSLSALL